MEDKELTMITDKEQSEVNVLMALAGAPGYVCMVGKA